MKPWLKKRKAFSKNIDDESKIKSFDEIFSKYIRLRDSNKDGYGKCVTCNHWAHWTQMQCGHFMSRKHLATRFDEKNCSMQCGGCNGPYGNGKQYDHSLAIDKRWGQGTAEKMRILSMTTRKWYSFELQAAIGYYKQEVKRLKAEKGMV